MSSELKQSIDAVQKLRFKLNSMEFNSLSQSNKEYFSKHLKVAELILIEVSRATPEQVNLPNVEDMKKVCRTAYTQQTGLPVGEKSLDIFITAIRALMVKENQ